MSSAAQALERSRLKQLELMGGDVDLEAFTLEMRNKAGIQLISAISSANINRTCEGASTLTVEVDDDLQRTIQRSGKLGRKVDVNLDGLWFTLVGVRKTGRKLMLTFEEREVNILRYYNTWLQAMRNKTTRAEFVLRMIKEVKEVQLKWIIPELSDTQQISDLKPGEILVDKTGAPLGDYTSDPAQAAQARQPGIPGVPGLTVKGDVATLEQLGNANTVLRTGVSLGARRKVLVCSIMTAIDESSIINLTGGDRDSVGVFQQRASQGWPATRNIAVDAAEFFKRAIQLDSQQPGLSYNDLCQGVQHSGTPEAYGEFRAEGEAFVNAFGVSGGDSAAATATSVGNNQNPRPPVDPGQYQFTRGTLTQDGQGRKILTKENSWECMQRLASEVNFRCFCVSGTIYFVSETYLFASVPFMTISEDSPGVQWIDYDYDEGKRYATVTVQCHLSRWSAPPGGVVRIQNMGIVNGSWLVNDVSRDLYSTEGTITLKKPLPILPEPIGGKTSNLLSLDIPAISMGKDYPAGADSIVQPIPIPYNRGHGGIHDTEGLPNYPAIDFFGGPGSPVIAPENGTIDRFSGHDPLLGPIGPPGGPLGWSLYLIGQSGTTYYMTHLNEYTCQEGEKVPIGRQIATVADYDKFGRQSHVHCGVNGGNVNIDTLGLARII